MKEEFKMIPGFPGYRISNRGRVLSLKYGKRRILKTSLDRYGYEKISLQKRGKQYSRLIHRLVAEAFLPRDLFRGQINHIDGDKLNNRLNNLEWCTAAENKAHAVNNGLTCHGQKQHLSKLNPSAVAVIRFLNRTPAELAEIFEVTEDNIRFILKRKTWRRVPDLQL